jgi:hypothetical protein
MVVPLVTAFTTFICDSSAWTADERLIAPTAAKPTVHLFNFILSFLRWFLVFFCAFYRTTRNKHSLFRRRNGVSGRILRNRPPNATSFFALGTHWEEAFITGGAEMRVDLVTLAGIDWFLEMSGRCRQAFEPRGKLAA